MTIFKAFLQILRRNVWVLLTYSAILIIFSVFSLQANESTINFEATRPDLYLNNLDQDSEFSRGLADYLRAHNNIVELTNDGDALSGALFYRQINYAITIPEGFGADFMAGKSPTLAVRSTGDYNAALAEMTLERYLDTAASLRLINPDPAKLVRDVEATLADAVTVELASHRDVTGLDRAAFYYNFLNYPFLVGCIFMICIVMLSFRDRKVAQRIAVGGTSSTHINRVLLLANSLFALVLWLAYVVISFLVVGPAMFSLQGLGFILNSFVFALCVTTLAFLLANILHNRNALTGLTNVIGLGSSFLCGAFVPVEWLPSSVLALAHVLPSFWYIDANEKIKALEDFSWEHISPILFNMLVVLIFALVFIIATNLLAAIPAKKLSSRKDKRATNEEK